MPQPFVYSDLGGGINAGAAAATIQSRQMAALVNFYPYDTRLRRRGGTRRVTPVAWGQNITAIAPYKLEDGTFILVVGGQSDIGKLSSGSLVTMARTPEMTIGSSSLPWTFFQYKNYLYAMRRGTGFMMRISADLATSAGMDAPTTAATLADGGAGVLSAANYRGVFTNYNSLTDYESNPGPVSNTLALGGSKQISWSGIATSLDPFVNARRIYRTLPDQVGVYFKVATIYDNSSTLYVADNVPVANLGAPVSFDMGVPPGNLEYGVIWNERLFATDRRDVYFSEYLHIEGFGDDAIISVYPDDGDEIRALHPFGERLIIAKTNKVFYLVGAGTASSGFGLYVLNDVHGCLSHHSMKSAENQLFWFGSGNAVYWSDGTNVRDISTPQIAPYLAQVSDALAEQVIGAIFPRYNQYVLSVPQTGYTTNRVVLVYNYKDKAWTTYTHADDAPQYIGDYFDANYDHHLYASFYDGKLYDWADESYNYDDDGAVGSPISASFTTKADDFQMPGYRKYFDQVWLLMPRVVGGTPLTLEAIQDELAVADSRTVSLDIADSEWKAYKLSSNRGPGTRLQLRGTYTGAQQVDIDQILFQIGVLQRGPGQPR